MEPVEIKIREPECLPTWANVIVGILVLLVILQAGLIVFLSREIERLDNRIDAYVRDLVRDKR